MFSKEFWKTDLAALKHCDKGTDVLLHAAIFAYDPKDSSQYAVESYEEIIPAKVVYSQTGEVSFETTHRGERLILSPNEESGAIGVACYRRSNGLEVNIIATEYAFSSVPLCMNSRYAITASSEYIASFEDKSQRDVVLGTLNHLVDQQKLGDFATAGPFRAFDKKVAKECNCTKMFIEAAVILDKAYEDITKAPSAGAMLVSKRYYATVIALLRDIGLDIQRDSSTGEHTVRYQSDMTSRTLVFSSVKE